MLKTYGTFFIAVSLMLFIASCSRYTDKKEILLQSIPKNKKESDSQRFEAWVFSKEKNKCYIYSFPVSSYGFYLDRKIHYLQINDKKEISVLGGLPYKKDSKVKIDIASYSLFLTTLDDKAWANNEDFIINYFLKNKDSIFFIYNEFASVDDKENSAVDKYTMHGFTEAWNHMNSECKVSALIKEEVNPG